MTVGATLESESGTAGTRRGAGRSASTVAAALAAVAVILLALRRVFPTDSVWPNKWDATNWLVPFASWLGATPIQSSGFDPGILGGWPMTGNPHFHPLYPLLPLFTRSIDPDVPISGAQVMNNFVAVHWLILVLGCAWLYRTMGASRLASVTCAVLAGMSWAVLSQLGWWNIHAATAWMPFAIAGTMSLVLRPSWRSASAAAGACCLVILAQPAQVLVLTTASCGCLAVLLVIVRRGRIAWAGLATWGLAAAVGVALVCGPYLRRVLAFHAESIRWLGGDRGHVVGNAPVPRTSLMTHGYSLGDLATIPYATFNQAVIIGHLFLGALAATLAVSSGVFAFRRGGDPTTRAVAVTALLMALLSLSWIAGTITFHLPVLNKVREVQWWGVAWSLFGFGLTALGIDRLADRQFRRLALGVGITVLGLGVLTAVVRGDQTPGLALQIGCLAGGLAIVTFGSRRSAVRLVPWLICVPLLLAAAIQPHAKPRTLLKDHDVYGAELNEALATLTALTPQVPDRMVYRIDFPERSRTVSWDMQAMPHGFRTFQGYGSPLNYRQFREMYTMDRRDRAAAIAGLKYRLLPSSEAVTGPWQPVARIGRWRLDEREDALPRVFWRDALVGRYDPSDAQSYFDLAERRPWSDRAVALPTGTAISLPALGAATPTPSADAVRVEEERPDRMVVRTTTETQGLLVLNEFEHPEWQATVDGAPAELNQVNLNQMGLVLPGGEHRVEFRFGGSGISPDALLWPYVGAVVAAVCVVVLAVLERLAQRRRRGAAL